MKLSSIQEYIMASKPTKSNPIERGGFAKAMSGFLSLFQSSAPPSPATDPSAEADLEGRQVMNSFPPSPSPPASSSTPQTHDSAKTDW